VKDAEEIRTDLDLVAAANRGERAAFEVLYNRYRDWAWMVALRFCGNEDDAADVLQETFLYFFNKFPDFELRCRLKTFLYPAIKHLALNKLRGVRTTVGLTDEEMDSLPAPAPRNPGAERADLEECLASLPSQQCEVVILRFADGLELQEIAEALSIPLGTVKSRLHNALETLKATLGPSSSRG
jgi:RNA polymerase sigma-70 factor (ECF subfamily)